MSRAACTIVAKPCLAQARVIAQSFSACHPDIPIVVLLADNAAPVLDAGREPYGVFGIRGLEIPSFEQLRFRYAQQQLSYAVTPYFLSYLLDRGFERVLFFKQESLVLGSHADVFELLQRYDVVMTPHLVSPLSGHDAIDRELNVLLSGSYNVGLLGVRDRPAARRFLDWWKRRTFTHCLHDVRGGMHWEQRWLDLVPAMFDGVHVLRDPCFNVGHWNLPDRRIEVRGSRVMVDGGECRLFRCSGFPAEEPGIVTRYNTRLTPSSLGDAWTVFERFRSLLYESGHAIVSQWPYAWAAFDNGVAIPDLARDIYRSLGDDVNRFGDPLVTGSNSFFEWLNEPVDAEIDRETTITRLWAGAYRTRSDVARAFPEPFGADRRRFVDWTRRTGWREMRIDPVFLPAGAA